MALRRRHCAWLVATGLLLLAGCASSPDSPANGTTGTAWTPTPGVALPACVEYEISPAPSVPGGDPIVDAISHAPLPDGVVLSPGTQVLPSAEKPGVYDAIVHVCTMPLTRAKLIRIGDSIATTISADPVRSKLATLTVQSWVQIGTDAAGADPNTPSISLDFQTYATTSGAAVPVSAW